MNRTDRRRAAMFVGHIPVPDCFAAAFVCANRLPCQFVDVDAGSRFWHGARAQHLADTGVFQYQFVRMLIGLPKIVLRLLIQPILFGHWRPDADPAAAGYR